MTLSSPTTRRKPALRILSIETTFLFPLVIAGLTLLILARTSRADWVVDHYEINGTSTDKQVLEVYTEGSQSLYDSHYNRKYDSMTETRISTRRWSSQGQKLETTINGKLQPYSGSDMGRSQGASISWSPRDSSTMNALVTVGTGPQKASASATIRVVFKWQRRQVWNAPSNAYQPDSTDNPPAKCWFYETASINGSQSTRSSSGYGMPYWQERGYNDVEFSFRVKHPFGIPYQGCTPFIGSATYGAGFQLQGSHVSATEVKVGDFAIGPDRSFSMEVNHHTLVDTGRYSNGNVSWGYSAEPVKFQLLSRLKTDHNPADLVTDFVGPSGSLPYGTSTIAAGHQQTDINEHKADLVIEVQHPIGWGYWGNVGNVKMKDLPAMKIADKEGVEQDAALLTPATGFDGILKEGRAALGDLLSSDKIKEISVSPKNAVGTSTRINQVWDQSDDWTFDSFFLKPEAQLPVTFRPKFAGDKPIEKHSIKFKVTKILVSGYDAAIDDERTRYYTADPTEVDATATPPVVLGNIETYAKFVTPIVTDSGNGVYNGLLQLTPPEDQLVEDVEFGAEDMGVFAEEDE